MLKDEVFFKCRIPECEVRTQLVAVVFASASYTVEDWNWRYLCSAHRHAIPLDDIKWTFNITLQPWG